MAEYVPKGIDDTTQVPTAITTTYGKTLNAAFGQTLPAIATTAEVGAVTGLDTNNVQQVYCTEDNKIYISEIGATTYALSTVALT